ncbi:hypothetical protein NDU88_008842, partial [Pleurodeles waltl]
SSSDEDRCLPAQVGGRTSLCISSFRNDSARPGPSSAPMLRSHIDNPSLEGSALVPSCDANVVRFSSGASCESGPSHRSDGQLSPS